MRFVLFAPFLVSKKSDPAVLVADEKGNHIISLLSGHLGGGNELTLFLAGALGAALGRMVASLTIGKKKYADVEEEMIRLAEEADRLRQDLMDLVQADIDIFKPLSELYGMKAETEEEQKA